MAPYSRRIGQYLTADEEILILREACRILGVRIAPSSPYGKRVREHMRTRIRERYDEGELIEACRRAAEEHRNSFARLKHLHYVWGQGFKRLLTPRKRPRVPEGVRQLQLSDLVVVNDRMGPGNSQAKKEG